MNTLQQFHKARPHVTLQGIAEDSGLAYQTVVKIENGSLQMNATSETLLRSVYKKYGWEPKEYEFEKLILLDDIDIEKWGEYKNKINVTNHPGTVQKVLENLGFTLIKKERTNEKLWEQIRKTVPIETKKAVYYIRNSYKDNPKYLELYWK